MILHKTNILEAVISSEKNPLGVLLIKGDLEITLLVSRPSLGNLFFPGIQGCSHEVLTASPTCILSWLTQEWVLGPSATFYHGCFSQ